MADQQLYYSGIVSMINSSESCFFFQAEDGIRDLVRSRGLGDVYKRQGLDRLQSRRSTHRHAVVGRRCDRLEAARIDAVYLSLIHI